VTRIKLNKILTAELQVGTILPLANHYGDLSFKSNSETISPFKDVTTFIIALKQHYDNLIILAAEQNNIGNTP